LSIDSDVEAGQRHGEKMAFPLSRKGNALTMNKIDLPVESGHGVNPSTSQIRRKGNLLTRRRKVAAFLWGFLCRMVGDEAAMNVLQQALHRYRINPAFVFPNK
jgi:hypothetical protein